VWKEVEQIYDYSLGCFLKRIAQKWMNIFHNELWCLCLHYEYVLCARRKLLLISKQLEPLTGIYQDMPHPQPTHTHTHTHTLAHTHS